LALIGTAVVSNYQFEAKIPVPSDPLDYIIGFVPHNCADDDAGEMGLRHGKIDLIKIDLVQTPKSFSGQEHGDGLSAT
jgi:hypothetical protein